MESEPIRKRLCKNCRHRVNVLNYEEHQTVCLPGNPLPYQKPKRNRKRPIFSFQQHSQLKDSVDDENEKGESKLIVGDAEENKEVKKQNKRLSRSMQVIPINTKGDAESIDFVVCQTCGKNQTFKELDTHPLICPNRLMRCHYCKIYYPKTLMSDHQTVCPGKPKVEVASRFPILNKRVEVTKSVTVNLIEDSNSNKIHQKQVPAVLLNKSIVNPKQSTSKQISQIQPKNTTKTNIQKKTHQQNQINTNRNIIPVIPPSQINYLQPQRQNIVRVVSPKRNVIPVIPPRRDIIPVIPPISNSSQSVILPIIKIDQNQPRPIPPNIPSTHSLQQLLRINNNRISNNGPDRNSSINTQLRHVTIFRRTNLLNRRQHSQPKSTYLSKDDILRIPIVYFQKRQQKQECSICCMQIRNKQMIPKLACMHLYHTTCLSKWLAKNSLCPLCKYDISKLVPNYCSKYVQKIVRNNEVSRWYGQQQAESNFMEIGSRSV